MTGSDKQIVDHREHTMLIEERRVGKTSMVWAVLDRVRARDEGWVIEADLSRGPIIAASGLAGRLAEQARASNIRVDSRKEQIGERLRGAIEIAGKPIVATIAHLLEVDELGTAADVAQSIDQSLAPSEDGADIRAVLRALIAAAVVADKLLVVFVDEAQRLSTDWVGDDDSDYVMEDHAGHVVLVLAGSERAALEQLLADGQPLHRDGVPFTVRPIRDEDWHYELPRRFSEAGLTVDHERIDQILDASGRHPERTMRVCLHVTLLAVGPFEISEALVDQAIQDAARHASWPR